jgi:hypothetical protein
MIRYQELVPDYYVEKSRDFQVLCRLYDFTLNATKYNIDSMNAITDTRRAKDTILPLIGDKFGIYDRESYSNRFLLEALPIALKYKGSLKAVNILINAFLDSQEIFDYVTAFVSKDEDSAVEISEILNRDVKPYTIVIFISDYPDMTSLHILDEYLQMVIPSGMIVEYMFGLNKVIFEKFRYKEYVFLFYTNESNIGGTIVQDISLVKNRDDKYVGTVPEQYEADEFVKSVLSDIDINSVALATVSSAPEEVEE